MTASPKWLEKMSLTQARGMPHPVQGKAFNFYPVSLEKLLKFKDMAKAIGQALAVLMSSSERDSGSISRQFASDSQPGLMDTEIVADAVKPEVVKMRMEAKQNAVGKLMDAIGDNANLAAIGELIMDSLRENFPRNHPDNPPPIEFMNQMDAPLIVEFLVGVAKANKGMFGPLGDRLSEMGQVLKLAQQAVMNKLGGLASEGKTTDPAPSPASPAPTPG
jgi:hypothetical protein